MGLLDTTDEDTNAAISNGLLNFVAMANKKRPFMGLLAGLQGYEQTQASQRDRALKLAMEERKLAMEEQFKQAQIGEYQAQAQQRLAAIRDGEAKAAEAGRIQSLVRGAGTVQPMEAVPMQDARGVTGERKTPDYTWLMQQGVPPEFVKQLAESRNLGRDKVGGQFDTVMPGTNRAGTQLRSDYGDAIGGVVAKPIEFGMADTGTRLVPYDKSNPTAIGKEQTLESKASTAVQWANHGLAKQRLAQEGQGQLVETPSGYVRVGRDNTATPITVGGQPVMGKGGANMTEDQGKATGWLVQATNAYSNMQAAMKETPNAAKPGFNDALAAIPSFGLTGGIANTMRGADRQRFMQSASSMSEALLRAATGAGVNRDEAEQKIKELTPQFGDGEAVVAQKMASIPLYIKSLEVRAGPGAPKAASIFNGKSAPNLFDSADAILRGGR